MTTETSDLFAGVAEPSLNQLSTNLSMSLTESLLDAGQGSRGWAGDETAANDSRDCLSLAGVEGGMTVDAVMP